MCSFPLLKDSVIISPRFILTDSSENWCGTLGRELGKIFAASSLCSLGESTTKHGHDPKVIIDPFLNTL